MSGDNKEKNTAQEVKEWLIIIAIGIVLALLIRNFGFRITSVKGSSMEPNYVHGELVYTDILSYKIGEPKKNDIVICEYDSGIEDELFIKRIIAGPGDEIDIYYNEEDSCYKVKVNDSEIKEEYIPEPMLSKGDWKYPLTLTNDEYFVMGDNRNISADSRDSYIGLFSKDEILGKVRFKIINKT